MAVPTAYEPPSIQKAWQGFVAHVPILLLIWLASLLITGVGAALTWLIVLISASLPGTGSTSNALVSAGDSLGQFVQLLFAIFSSWVGVLSTAVPALYVDSGKTITAGQAIATLLRRPWRYLLAGLFFSLVTAIGLVLCIVPGIVIFLVTPIYVNRIFLTDQSITDAFAASFQAVYGSANGIDFIGLQVLSWLLVFVSAVCTCGLGAFVVVPVAAFYLQNAAYSKGLVR